MNLSNNILIIFIYCIISENYKHNMTDTTPNFQEGKGTMDCKLNWYPNLNTVTHQWLKNLVTKLAVFKTF